MNTEMLNWLGIMVDRFEQNPKEPKAMMEYGNEKITVYWLNEGIIRVDIKPKRKDEKEADVLRNKDEEREA